MRNRAGLETQARILEVTRALLAETGLEGITIKRICDQAGIRAGSFYNIFESKEQVILSVVREAIQAVDPARGGSVSLEDLVQTYVRFILDEPELARVYFLVALTGGLTDETIRARVSRHHRERLSRFTDAAARRRSGIDRERVERRMEALLAALNGYALQSLIEPGFDLAGHAEALLTLESELQT